MGVAGNTVSSAARQLLHLFLFLLRCVAVVRHNHSVPPPRRPSGFAAIVIGLLHHRRAHNALCSGWPVLEPRGSRLGGWHGVSDVRSAGSGHGTRCTGGPFLLERVFLLLRQVVQMLASVFLAASLSLPYNHARSVADLPVHANTLQTPARITLGVPPLQHPAGTLLRDLSFLVHVTV